MNTRKQDSHGRSTKDIIKDALCMLIAEKSYREITVVAIARTADINRKTFYNHFPSIEDALLDIEKDYTSEISGKISRLNPDDIGGAIFVYYDFLDTDDPVRSKLLYNEDYEKFFVKLDSDVSKILYERFCKAGNSDLILGYLRAVSGIYLRWRTDNTDNLDLKELADKAARLIYSGLGTIRD